MRRASDWCRPTQASTWTTGHGAVPLAAEHDAHEIGRRHHHAEHRGRRDRADQPRGPDPGATHPLGLRLETRDRRVEDLLERPGDALERHEHQVVGDGVETERRGADEAADQQVVDVAIRVEEQPRAEHVRAEAGHLAAATCARSADAGRQPVHAHRSTVDATATATCWATTAHRPQPAASPTTAVTAPAVTAPIWRSSSPRKSIARVSRAEWVAPSAVISEREREDAEDVRDLGLAVEARDRRRREVAADGQQHADRGR